MCRFIAALCRHIIVQNTNFLSFLHCLYIFHKFSSLLSNYSIWAGIWFCFKAQEFVQIHGIVPGSLYVKNGKRIPQNDMFFQFFDLVFKTMFNG